MHFLNTSFTPRVRLHVFTVNAKRSLGSVAKEANYKMYTYVHVAMRNAFSSA